MSTSIENQVVNMTFNNKDFEANAGKTLGTLQRIKDAVSFKAGSDVFANLGKGASLTGLDRAVEDSTGKFSILSTAAAVALGNIAAQAIQTGATMVKSFAFDGITDGFREYETQINAVQTILSNTRDQGANLQDVNDALDQLNTYADKTIYNFGEMTRNIGTFTAAGVDLGTSVESIKGIANLAAMSGSSSQQASTAMYQLSQAIAAGKVGLQDWNSVVNAGMGGRKFQTALANTAVAMGLIEENAVSLDGPMKKLTINGQNFRNSIQAQPGQESWLTSDVLVNTLSQFSNELTKADLIAQGFSETQADALLKEAQMAEDAATKVKTFTQLVDTMKEAVGSGWAQTFRILLGDFKEARKIWTAASDELGGIIEQWSDGRNTLIKNWKKLGGRTVLIEAITNAWEALLGVVKPIHEAFRNVFPATTEFQLYKMTVWVRDLFESFKMGAASSKNWMSTWRGVFAIFGIGALVIKELIGFLFDLIGRIFEGSGAMLNLTGSLGDIIYGFYEWLKASDSIGKFFDGLATVVAFVVTPLVRAFQLLGYVLGDIFRGDLGLAFNTTLLWISEQLRDITQYASDVYDKIASWGSALNLDSFEGAFGLLRNSRDSVANLAVEFWNWAAALGIVQSAMEYLTPVAKAVFGPILIAIAAVGIALKKIFTGDGASVFQAIGEELKGLKPVLDWFANAFAGIVNYIKGLWDKFSSDTAAALYAGYNTALSYWTKFRNSFQTVINAFKMPRLDPGEFVQNMTKAFMKIGAVIQWFGGIFQAVWVGIGPAVEIVWNILKGFGVFFGNMMSDLGENLKHMGFEEFMALLNTGIVMTGWLALRKFFSAFGEVGSNLADTLDAATGALKSMQKNVLAAAILKIAIAVAILAGSLWLLSQIPKDKLTSALSALAGMLGALVVSLYALSKAEVASPGLFAAIASLIFLAAALAVMAKAVERMSDMNWDELAKGLTGLAVMMGALVAFMFAAEKVEGMGTRAIFSVIAVAGSVYLMAVAIERIGSFDGPTLTKGLVGMGVVMVALGAFLLVLDKVDADLNRGFGSLLLLSVALWALSKAISIYASMDTGEFIDGLVKVGLTLLVFGFTLSRFPKKGVISTSIALGILSFSLMFLSKALREIGSMDMEQIGWGLAAMGAALLILGLAMEKMNGTDMAGLAAVMLSLSAMATALQTLGAMPLSAIATAIGALSAVFLVLFLAVAAFQYTGGIVVLMALAKSLVMISGAALVAALALMLAATAFATMAAVGTAGVAVIVLAITNILALIPMFAQQMALGMIAFAYAIAQGGDAFFAAFTTLGRSALRALIALIPEIGLAARALISEWLATIRHAFPEIWNTGWHLLIKFLEGVRDNIGQVADLVTDIFLEWLDAMERNRPRIIKGMIKYVIGLINDMADAIDEHAGEFGDAGGNLAWSLVEGIVKGIGEFSGRIQDEIEALAGRAYNWFMDAINAHSPSRLFMIPGGFITQGIAIGIAGGFSYIRDATSELGDKTYDAMNSAMERANGVFDTITDFNPTITPILDLTGVEAEASRLSDILTPEKLGTDQLATANRGYEDLVQSEQDLLTTINQVPTNEITYIQNNHSPKELSPIEIYRNTRAQLALQGG